MGNNIKQDINKSRVELRDRSRVELRDRQMQTREYISRLEPLALRPRLHVEGFLLSPQKNSTKKITL